MLGENLYSQVELILKLVNEYQLSNRNIQFSNENFNIRLQLIENTVRTLTILNNTQKGSVLLSKWGEQCQYESSNDIHIYFSNLMQLILKDVDEIQSVAIDHQLKGLNEFLVGVIVLLLGPSLFIYLLPVLINPIVFATVFLFSCVIIPYIANVVLNRSVDNFYAKRMLINTFVLPSSKEKMITYSNYSFFKNNDLSEVKDQISEDFKIRYE